ncbi:MAG: Manganese transport system membrane protein MntB [Acidimicrobiales bacterium]|nr:MAG: metal ABC transporter permease [Actinomycetota bacterium]MBV6509043.1 Manganese transport system membrane protein MntB [Acidimicrobiales bacterium]RIK06249.1 MAG: ABC transporter permease [Acidobacteriota bacterium]
MDWLIDPLQYSFMQKALLAGILAAVTTSLVGIWVVLRGMTFMGDALAHGVLPGIAIAALWGLSLPIGASASAVVMVALIALVQRRSRLPEDAAIGLLFVGMLALGVVIISRSDAFAQDLTSFLFGDVLGVGEGDLVMQGGATILVAASAIVFYRAFLALSLDEVKAALLGLHPKAAHVLLLALIAVAVVSSFQAVGALLVFGLMVGPPATASLLVRRVPVMITVSVAIGVLAVCAGLLLSYHFDLAGGAMMSGLSVAGFFVVLAGQALARLRRGRQRYQPGFELDDAGSAG